MQTNLKYLEMKCVAKNPLINVMSKIASMSSNDDQNVVKMLSTTSMDKMKMIDYQKFRKSCVDLCDIIEIDIEFLHVS